MQVDGCRQGWMLSFVPENPSRCAARSTLPAALAPLSRLPLRRHLLGGSPVPQPPSTSLL